MIRPVLLIWATVAVVTCSPVHELFVQLKLTDSDVAQYLSGMRDFGLCQRDEMKDKFRGVEASAPCVPNMEVFYAPMTQYARNVENGSDSKVSQMIDQWKASEDVTRDGLKAMYRKAFPVFESDATLEDKMAYIDRIFEWFISSKEKYMIEHVVYTKKLVERIQELTSFPDTFPKEYLTEDYWLGQGKAMNQVVVRALVEFDKLFP